VHGLLDGKVDKAVVDLVAEAATLRWAGGRTFAAALERQALRAQLVTADRRGELEDVEDQLFRFARFVESSPDLRNVLGDRAIDRSRRQELVGELLSGRATESTIVLAKRAVVARERTFAQTIEGYVTLAAAQKNRVVATVRVAQPLSDDQRDRLRVALARQVGREVAIQEVIDPDILGGVRVELGDEVFEGTVSDRLEAARRLFG
jgi:F-type H+-transporting ATPase subunit delta